MGRLPVSDTFSSFTLPELLRTMALMSARVASRDRAGRILCLLALLPVLAVQPFGGVSLVLHAHGGDHHAHAVPAARFGGAASGDHPSHGGHHAAVETAAAVVHLADLDLQRAATRALVSPGPHSISGAAAAFAPRDEPVLPAPGPPPRRAAACLWRAGTPGLLLRGGALLL